MTKLITLIILWGIVIGLAVSYKPVMEEIEIPIKIEKVENKFMVIKSIGLGGAGVGGIAVPEIVFSSPQQFLETTQNEKIYCYFETEEGKSKANILKKVYVAFSQDRSLLYKYQDVYEKEGFFIKEWTNDSVTFTTYAQSLQLVIIFILLIVAFVVTFAFLLLF